MPPIPTRLAMLGVLLWLLVSCSTGPRPDLVDSALPTPSPTAAPTRPPESTVAPSPTSVEDASPTPEATPAEASSRGITEDTIRIGVVGTERVFPGHADAVRARAARTNRNGGIAGRQLEVVAAIDDGGDPGANAEAVRSLVQDSNVFAVVTASVAEDPAETVAFFEAEQVPHTTWGFAGGVCAPNQWGFGFSGCLNGFALGVEDAAPNPAFGSLLAELVPEVAEPTLVLVVGDGPSGEAAEAVVAELWGERLVEVIPGGEDTEASVVAEAVGATTADLVLVQTGVDRAIELHAALRAAGEVRPVIGDVTYVPGLLNDFSAASALEGAYALTQLPPQEALAEATQRIALDLQEIGAAGPDPANLILSQGHSVGYWSADVLVALLEGVDGELNTASLLAAVERGIDYDPELSGGPCPASSTDLRSQPSGGAAILQVIGGIYRPAVPWTC